MSKVQESLELVEDTIEDLKVDLHGKEVEIERLQKRLYDMQEAFRSIAREAKDGAEL